MHITKLALTLFAACLFAGCATDGPDMNPGGDDDGEIETPFTNGVSTLAGSDEAGFVDGSRGKARFNNPVNVLYRDGKLYVADFDNSKLRVIDVNTHVTTTLINQQGFSRPFGMVFAADGTLYVSTDRDPQGRQTDMSGTIWRVNTSTGATTVIANSIGRARGMAMLADGRIAVADYQHHVIQIVDPGNGQVAPLAGAWGAAGMVNGLGAAARFSAPYYIVVRGDGKLIVTDFENHQLRLVSMDGTTSTLSGSTAAGFADGAMATAKFSHPQAMSMAANGDIFVTDLGNYRIRKIVGDRIETVAGDGTAGYADDDSLLAAKLYGLEGLSVVPDGSMVYFADGNRGETLPYNRVRQAKLR